MKKISLILLATAVCAAVCGALSGCSAEQESETETNGILMGDTKYLTASVFDEEELEALKNQGIDAVANEILNRLTDKVSDEDLQKLADELNSRFNEDQLKDLSGKLFDAVFGLRDTQHYQVTDLILLLDIPVNV